MKIVKLPSGAELKITPAPFKDAKALYQAVLEEFKHVKIEVGASHIQVTKDVFCIALSSRAVEAALAQCMKRCLYSGKSMTDLDAVFEPVEARQDFISAMYEVAQENITPFTKDLFAQLADVAAKLKLVQS